MKKYFVCAVVFLFASFLFYGCGGDIYIDAESHDDIIKGMSPEKEHIPLDPSTVLYIDASTVFIDAENSSDIYNDMKSQMYQYIGTLVFIKGNQFDTTECNRQEQTLFNALENMKTDYDYADIQKAVENICGGNRQGMLITDFEFYKEGKIHDRDPYLSESFKKWLSRGYRIDILTEPYYEKKCLKKRFYVFFIDPQEKAPITNTMIESVKDFIVKGSPEVGECNWFTLVNSDVCIVRENDKNSCSNEIDVKTILYLLNDCELNIINTPWDDIKEYVMKLDSHNQVYEGENPIPIIDGLRLKDGNNFNVEKLKLVATNISKSYLQEQIKKDGSEGTISFDEKNDLWDISDAFEIKMDKDKEISIFVNEKIFNAKQLYSESDGFCGNLIRLDLVVDECSDKKIDNKSVFEWNTVKNGQQTGGNAICVSRSIMNVLSDIEIVPSGTLYTIYIQTESK